MGITRDGSTPGSEEAREDIRPANAAPSNASTKQIGFRQISMLNPRLISRNSGSEQAMTLKKLFEAEIDRADASEANIHIIPIDNNIHALSFPVVAVVMGVDLSGRNNGDIAYSAYLFAMAGNAVGNLGKREIQLAGETVYVVKTPGDAMNAQFRDECTAAINQVLGVNKNPHARKTKIVSMTSVPCTIKATDEHIARNCLVEAVNAIQTHIDNTFGKELGISTFDLGWLSQNDSPTSNVQFNNSALQDLNMFGNPVRSDITVVLSNRISSAQQLGLETQQRLCGVTGYIDLTYSQQTEVQRFDMYGNPIAGMMPATVQYQPRFVMTNIYAMDVDAFNLEMVAMGILSTVATLNIGNTWLNSFIDAARQPNSMHNPGALAIELDENCKEPLDLSGRTDAEIAAFLRTILYPTLVYSIDVPEEGEYSWLLGDIAGAARISTGQDTYTKQYNRLYNAFDRLTLGNFSKMFGKGQPLVFSAQNRIASGWYVTQQGDKRDRRDVDTLYMLNQNPGDLQRVIDWANTFDKTDIPSEKRCYVRDEINTNQFGSNIVQTGWVQRYDFNPVALDALVKAAVACGFQVKPEHIRQIADSQTRGNDNIRNLGMGNVDNGIYSTSGQTQGYTSSNTAGSWNIL